MKRRFSGELIFTLCIFIYILILSVMSFGYEAESRLFPFIVLLPTTAFLVLKLISLLNPKLTQVLEPDSGLFNVEKLDTPDTKISRESHSKDKTFVKEIKVILWLMALMVLVYTIGTVPAVIIFVFLFVKIYGRKNLITSSLFTIATWIFIHFLFVKILQVRFYIGMLEIPFVE